jgi:hypothetical protein
MLQQQVALLPVACLIAMINDKALCPEDSNARHVVTTAVMPQFQHTVALTGTYCNLIATLGNLMPATL